MPKSKVDMKAKINKVWPSPVVIGQGVQLATVQHSECQRKTGLHVLHVVCPLVILIRVLQGKICLSVTCPLVISREGLSVLHIVCLFFMQFTPKMVPEKDLSVCLSFTAQMFRCFWNPDIRLSYFNSPSHFTTLLVYPSCSTQHTIQYNFILPLILHPLIYNSLQFEPCFISLSKIYVRTSLYFFTPSFIICCSLRHV